MSKTGSGPFKVVTVAEALNKCVLDDAGAWQKYLHERDFDTLIFREGEKPTVFHCRPLTLVEVRQVRNKSSEGDMNEAAFVRGVMKVENLEGATYLRPQSNTGNELIIPDSDLEKHFDEAMIQEIGSVIARRSFLAKSSVLTYPLPAISRVALEASLYRLAAQTKDTSR